MHWTCISKHLLMKIGHCHFLLVSSASSAHCESVVGSNMKLNGEQGINLELFKDAANRNVKALYVHVLS